MSHSRRKFMKGISLGAGYSLLAPMLHQLDLNAQGIESKLPKRFVFVAVSSGIIRETVMPQTLQDEFKSLEKFSSTSLKTHTLEPAMKSLEPYKEYLSIIQGLSGKMCQGGHTSNYGMLGVWRSPGEGSTPMPIRATVDAKLATMFPAGINHVTTGLTGKWGSRVTEGTVYPNISAAGPSRPIPFQTSPDLAFEQLFGTVASKDKYGSSKQLCKKNILDFIRSDVNNLQKKLPSIEKAKMDHYLHAVEDLKSQDIRIASLKESLKKHAPEMDEKYTSKVIERRQEAHFDLIAAALISGLTNVVTMKIDSSATYYRGLGINEKSVHGLGHNESSEGRTGMECRDIIRRHHFDILAELARKLKSVPEGNGNMLDNTMIIYMSPSGNKHHGTLEEWPIITLGGCGGRMKLPGRYLQFPGYGQKGHRTIGNWWTSVLNSYGDPVKHYGQVDIILDKNGIEQRGPLPQIMV